MWMKSIRAAAAVVKSFVRDMQTPSPTMKRLRVAVLSREKQAQCGGARKPEKPSSTVLFLQSENHLISWPFILSH